MFIKNSCGRKCIKFGNLRRLVHVLLLLLLSTLLPFFPPFISRCVYCGFYPTTVIFFLHFWKLKNLSSDQSSSAGFLSNALCVCVCVTLLHLWHGVCLPFKCVRFLQFFPLFSQPRMQAWMLLQLSSADRR